MLVVAVTIVVVSANAADFKISSAEDVTRAKKEWDARVRFERAVDPILKDVSLEELTLISASTAAAITRVQSEIENRSRLKKAIDPILRKYTIEELSIILSQASIHHGDTTPVLQAKPATPQSVINRDATVALIPISLLKKQADGTYQLNTSTTVGAAFAMCAREQFFNEPSAASCAGVLIAPDLVITAGHCVFNAQYLDLAVVFGYRVDGSGQLPAFYKADDVRFLTDETDVTNVIFGQDWGIVTLDHAVTVSPARIRMSGVVGDQDGVYVIGYPAGMPESAAGIATANVKDNRDNDVFMADIDTLERSSGSPVFNRNDDTVEGIFEHGDKWVNTGTCNLIMRCPASGICADEEVTRIRCLPLAPDVRGVLKISGKTSQPCK
ncbi:MAG TPA: trypsin-like peptidase domain-containing protein [Thermoanaerobaculia bacterium]|nr:trypsin-like peptidase domain-containing protein [Thermoanaerobaculia bacterium]